MPLPPDIVMAVDRRVRVGTVREGKSIELVVNRDPETGEEVVCVLAQEGLMERWHGRHEVLYQRILSGYLISFLDDLVDRGLLQVPERKSP